MTLTARRFFTLTTKDNTQPGDTERLQLFYVIARTDEIWERATSIYDFEKHSLKPEWDFIFDGTLGKMMRRTIHLYNSIHKDIDSYKLFCGMDDHNKVTMVNALQIYLGIWDYEQEMK